MCVVSVGVLLVGVVSVEVMSVGVVGVEGLWPVLADLREATLDQRDKFLIQWRVGCSLLQAPPCDHSDWALCCNDVAGGHVCDGSAGHAGNDSFLLLNFYAVSL